MTDAVIFSFFIGNEREVLVIFPLQIYSKTAACKYHAVIPAENFNTLSTFSLELKKTGISKFSL